MPGLEPLLGLREIVGAPAFTAEREHPIGKGAVGRKADCLALQIGNGFDRRVCGDDDRKTTRRADGCGNRDHRRAFDRLRHGRAAGHANIDAIRHQGLLKPRSAGENRNLHLEPLFGEDAFLDPDIEGKISPGLARRLARADLVGGENIRCSGDQAERYRNTGDKEHANAIRQPILPERRGA